MAPRAPKTKADDTSSVASTSTLPSPLKPKTLGAKVEKGDKAKSSRAKVAKTVKEEQRKDDKAKEEDDEFKDKVKEEKPRGTKATVGKRSGEKEKEKEKDSGAKDKDGKEKVKAVTGDEAIEVMKKYLELQNRPYSATEVSANLHGKVTKTVADKLLKEMEQNGLIKAKATNGDKKGSQWVFWAIQDPADAATPSELASMDTQINTLRDALPSLKSSLKLLTTKLTTLRAAPTTSELAATIETLQREIEDKKQRLSGFESGAVKTVMREEVDKVEKEWKYWGGKRTARMRAYKGLEALLLEGMTRDEIVDKVGVEPDTYEV